MKKAGKLYLRVAEEVLRTWFATDVSDERREELLMEADFDKLENEFVHGVGSIKAGINSLARQVPGVPPLYTDHFLYGIVADTEKLRQETAKLGTAERAQVCIRILSDVHASWIAANPQKFFDEKREAKRYMFMPLELIGFEEATADLVFVKPMLEELFLSEPEEVLRRTYKDAFRAFDWRTRFSEDPVRFIWERLGQEVPVSREIQEYLAANEMACEAIAWQVNQKLTESGILLAK